MTHQVTAKSNPRDIVQHSVAEALHDQKWYHKRKESITLVAGYLLQMGQIALLTYSDSPAWVVAAIGIVIFMAQIGIIAGTKGAVTDSMVTRLGEKAESIPVISVSEKVSRDHATYEETLKARYGG